MQAEQPVTDAIGGLRDPAAAEAKALSPARVAVLHRRGPDGDQDEDSADLVILRA